MKHTLYLCYIVLLFLSVSTLYGQTSTFAYEQLDSLLMTADPEAALEFWSTVCTQATAECSDTACETVSDQLKDIVDYVTQLKSETPAYIGEIVASGRTQSAEYRESYAGRDAARAFQAFLNAADSGDNKKAVTYHRTARFFKIRYLSTILANAHADYARAGMYFDEGKFNSADSTLKGIQFDPGNHPVLLSFADTISYLQQRVDQKILERERYQYNWGRNTSVDRKFTFSLSATLTGQPGSNTFPLIMSNAGSTIQVEVARVVPSFRLGLGLEGWYQLSERAAVGVGVDKATFAYSSIHTTELIFFDFEVDYARAYVGGRYYTRSEVGLRPYLGFELGVMRFKYDEFNCVVVQVEPEYAIIYKVAEDDFRSGETTLTLGTQFVPNSGSHWGINTAVSWHVPFEEHKFLSSPRVSFSMKLDILI